MPPTVLVRAAAWAAPKVCVLAGLAAVSGLAITATPSTADAAGSTSPARISWFYKPPRDGTAPATIVSRHAEVILTGRADLAFRDRLRQAGWTKRVWQYLEQPVTSAPLDGPCGTFAVWWDLWDNQVAWEHQAGVAGSNDFCKHIHPNEGWMLHRPSDGSRITRRYGNQTQYYMNPGSTAWRTWFADRVKRDVGAWGYDAVFLDDVWTNPAQHGGFKEYPTAAGYQQAVIGFLQHLRSRIPGVRVIGNIDNPEIYGPALDGWLHEAFAGYWSNRYQPESELAWLMGHVERDAAAGKDVFLIAQGERGDTRKLRFAYAAYLMVAHDNVSFRYSNVNAYEQLWNYPEYDLPLGHPAGPRRSAGGSTWRRDFEAGTALVNLSATAAQTVQLDAPHTTQDGATVTSVTVAPQTGVLLLRADGGSLPPAPPPPPPPTEPVPPPTEPTPPPPETQAPAPPGQSSPPGKGRAKRSFAPMAKQLRERGVDVERFLRRRPAVRQAYGLQGTPWGGQTFYTRRAFARWLDRRGATYRKWARKHPAQARSLVK